MFSSFIHALGVGGSRISLAGFSTVTPFSDSVCAAAVSVVWSENVVTSLAGDVSERETVCVFFNGVVFLF